MKIHGMKYLTVCLTAALCLTLAACGGKKSVDTQELAELADGAAQADSLCAVAYCGGRVGDYDALEAFELLKIAEKYPELAGAAVLDTGGEQFYLLVPSPDAVSVEIEGYGMDEDGNVGPDGEIIYREEAGPVAVLCNVSDIIPDIQVTVTGSDGNTLVFSPMLSGEDGSVYAPGTADFTDYEWAAANAAIYAED